jgi:hypothetical protein
MADDKALALKRKQEIRGKCTTGARPISSGAAFCRMNAAFHLAWERRIYAPAKNSVVRLCTTRRASPQWPAGRFNRLTQAAALCCAFPAYSSLCGDTCV